MLELAILGLLKEQDLHGYELKKRLGETLGVASGVSFGSLYPALGRLERAGALRTVEPPTADAPADRAVAVIPQTGSLGGELAAWRARGGTARATGPRTGGRSGRSRKVYAITAAGETLFEELLAAEQGTGDDSRLFHLRLAFARYLSADARLGMLERRRAHLLDRLSRAGSGRTNRRIDAYVRSLIDHDRESTEHDLSWVERLIALERDGVRTPVPVAVAAVETSSDPAPDGPDGTDHPAPAWAVAGAGRSTSERSTPERSTPERSTPERSTPERSTPERSTPRRSTPERSTPRRSIAAPTLSGFRPGSVDIPRSEGPANQEESTR